MAEETRNTPLANASEVDAALSDAGTEKRQQECITVVARVRPSDHVCPSLRLKSQCLEVTVPRSGGDPTNPRIDEYRFQFANVFGPQTTQADLFNGTARDLVIGALDGVNCTIFAYGQTGSGKTFTICGGKGSYSERGIIPRALGCVFDTIQQRQDNVNYTVKVAFIEVYKEVGYNLLAKDFGKSANWPIVSVSIIDSQPVLNNANPVTIASEDEGLHQYFIGDTHRTVAETPHNLNSSRSHCIFTIFIEATDPVARTVRTSKVQIVDLAGSERLKPFEIGSQNDKVLMAQAISINCSLHNLEVVINALNKSPNEFVPYRGSFLTKLLKDALGGNARAVMVATVNPSEDALPDTLSTCRFSQRVANVQTNAKINEELDPQLVIEALKKEKAELRAALAAAEGNGDVEELSPDELRCRIRSFLEDDTGGAGGGAKLSVGCLSDAFAAFRIFRELFWEMLRSRPAIPTKEVEADKREETKVSHAQDPTTSEKCIKCGGQSIPGPTTPVSQQNTTASRAAGDDKDDKEVEQLRAELKEREGELRLLRAALAAQPARVAPPPARAAPPRKAICLAKATQTEAQPAKRSKPKRPSSADARPKKPAASFSMDDVVERSFARNDSRLLLPKIADPRVPDFRNLRPATEHEDGENSVDVDLDQTVRRQSSIDSLRAGVPSHAKDSWIANATEIDKRPSSPAPKLVAENVILEPTRPRQVGSASSASSAWLSATTALTAAELAVMGDTEKAKEVFLQHDPRAGDIWPNDMKKLRTERLERMEEARTLGEEIERMKEAKAKVQTALEALKVKLRDAEANAAVDPAGPAQTTVATLRKLLSVEEPRLVQLLQEKQQRYELDYARLAELKRELSHLKHGEEKMSAAIQAEFTTWRQAVEQRYPGAIGAPMESPTATADSLPPSCRSSPSGAPPPLPRTSPTRVASPQKNGSSLLSSNGSTAIAHGNPIPPEPSPALAKAEAALASLRQRLEEARQNGDLHRQQMLEQLLSVEEPRLARLRAEQS